MLDYIFCAVGLEPIVGTNKHYGYAALKGDAWKMSVVKESRVSTGSAF